MHQTLSYTTANSFILGLDLSWWDSADMAFLLLLLLLLLLLWLLLLLLLMLMITFSFSESMQLLWSDSSSQEFSRDFTKYDWSLSKSDNWRGFSRNSSAPPSKHLSTISQLHKLLRHYSISHKKKWICFLNVVTKWCSFRS